MIIKNRSLSPFFFKKTALSLAFLSTLSHAQSLPEQVYDDSNASSSLTAAGNTILSLDTSPWTGLTSTDEGVVYLNSGATVLTGANLTIDYNNVSTTVPKFVIGGYLNSDGEVHDNKVSIINGKIDGDVYGGLSHLTKVTPSNSTDTVFSKSNQNNEANI